MRLPKTNGSLMIKILRDTVLILFIIVLVSIVYNFRNKEIDTVCALMADATESEEIKGVFIRDERPVTYSGRGTLSYNVADGGKVGDGSIIAEVYPTEEQIGRNREIVKLTRELEILKKIQNPGTLESAQPSDVSASIEENYRKLMYRRDMHDYDSISPVMESLLIQMSTYQIITEEVSDFDQQIADLNTKIMMLKQAEVHPIDTIKSDASAYFVSYCDGYENVLKSSDLDSITLSRLKEVVDSKLDRQDIVGKLVNGYDWYIAGIINNKKRQYAAGDAIKVRLESSSEAIDAVIQCVRDEGDPEESIIILACSNLSRESVRHRTETIELIKSDCRGLKIPREAIRFQPVKATGEDGSETSVTYKGVNVQKGEQVIFKKIDVIFEGGDYVLSEVHSGDPEYVALYDDILIEDAK